MFTSLLPDDEDYRIFYQDYAQRHNLKRFEKDYKGKRWAVTVDSINWELKRISLLQESQQVDELNHGYGCKLFKYDFAIAQSNESSKASGNRCVVFLDMKTHRQDVLLVYGKSDLPKNIGETQYIRKIVRDKYPKIWSRLDGST